MQVQNNVDNQVALPPRRVDAERNRRRIVQAAREAINELNVEPSMAEIARRAGVGMATLYRNFPTRLDLISELYREQGDEICAAAREATDGLSGTQAFFGWLERFNDAGSHKRPLAKLLLTDEASGRPVVNQSKARVEAAGEPLYAAAKREGSIRHDLPLAQILEAIVVVGQLGKSDTQAGRLIDLILDGLRRPEPGSDQFVPK